MSAATPVTRLAPSPTGALHLGNARSFLINWAIARQSGWQTLMRIEDLDGPRNKPTAAAEALDILDWLGIDWDGEPTWQAADLTPYRSAMRLLAESGSIFACSLSRSEIAAAATAPHADDHDVRFPPDLRPTDPTARQFDADDTNYRFITTDRSMVIRDMVMGDHEFNPHHEVGDFVIWTRRGEPAYQLAVVVDDARSGVTDVIRGDDLLPSAARQLLLYEALGYTPPRWWHLPLVRGGDGRRLAKRHGDTRISYYRQRDVPADRIIGLLAFWSGVTDRREPMSAGAFRDQFALARLPRQPVMFSAEDDAWLRSA